MYWSPALWQAHCYAWEIQRWTSQVPAVVELVIQQGRQTELTATLRDLCFDSSKNKMCWEGAQGRSDELCLEGWGKSSLILWHNYQFSRERETFSDYGNHIGNVGGDGIGGKEREKRQKTILTVLLCSCMSEACIGCGWRWAYPWDKSRLRNFSDLVRVTFYFLTSKLRLAFTDSVSNWVT